MERPAVRHSLTPRVLVALVLVLSLIGLLTVLVRPLRSYEDAPVPCPCPIVTLEREAYAEFAAGNHAAALAACDRIEQVDFLNARAMYVRGLVYEQTKQYPAARRWYDLADRHGEKYAAARLGGLPR